MLDRITSQADELRALFGDRAIREAEARLDEAMVWRDHQAILLYTDVCSELRHDQIKPVTWARRRPTLGAMVLTGLGFRSVQVQRARPGIVGPAFLRFAPCLCEGSARRLGR